MDEQQRYQFEAHGYIVAKAVLTPTQVADLRDRAQGCGTDLEGPDWHGGAPMLHLSKSFRDLLDHPRISPLLEEICGDRTGFSRRPEREGLPTFRLDHLDVHTPKDGKWSDRSRGGSLHGGNALLAPLSESSFFFSRQIYYKREGDVFHNGLAAVVYELEDTHCNGGGFACLAGSHKLGYAPPAECCDLSKGIDPIIQRVPAQAGDAIIFTEALCHATLPWTARGQTRTTLFYKFTPCSEAYSGHLKNIGDTAQYADMDERKTAILSPPPKPDAKGA